MVEGTETGDLCNLPVCEEPGIRNRDAAEAWAYRKNKMAIMCVTHLTEEGQKDVAFSARQRDVNEELKKVVIKFPQHHQRNALT